MTFQKKNSLKKPVDILSLVKPGPAALEPRAPASNHQEKEIVEEETVADDP
jgi:hypothetical protein